MIIPPDLQPLPVSAEDRSGSAPGDDFVSPSAVRRLLIGPMAIPGRRSRMFCDLDGFAGREDFESVTDSPFIGLAADAAYDPDPVERVAPGGVHPALVKPRHAPSPRRSADIEREFEKVRGSDRWWVLGMGVAVTALLVSGGLVELVSTLAARTTGATTGLRAEKVEAPVVSEQATPASDDRALASTAGSGLR